jgi:hypothetical protein
MTTVIGAVVVYGFALYGFGRFLVWMYAATRAQYSREHGASSGG